MTDPRTVRMVIAAVLILASLALVGAVVLAWRGQNADQAWMIVSGGLGVLGTLLASTKSQPDPAVAVVAEQARAAGAAETEATILQLDKATDPAG